ncbi:hypothetical protein ACFL3S_10215 [Gemmatimonadota bacterium]
MPQTGSRIRIIFFMMALAGCGGLPELPLDEIQLPGVSRFVQPEPAITTSIRDAVTEVPFLDDFSPAEPVALSNLPRGPNKGFLLTAPGFFALNTRSYCLHAGTYGPSAGDGYLYAPLEGPRAALIRRLVQNSVDHAEIPQRNVQSLIWAIQSHAPLQNAPLEMQRTAAVLLSQDDLQSLDAVALDVLTEAVRERAYRNLPESARRVLRAEEDLRRLLARSQTTYEEMERAAVLVGVPPRQDDDREVPRGRWSYHPDGLFVRYFPSGYTQTEVHIYLPEPVAFERDNQGRIVTVADGRGNRLEVVFDEEVSSLEPPEAPELSAHVFSSVGLTRFQAVGPEIALEETDTLAAPGWTFVGLLAEGGGVEAGGRNQAFPRVTERVQAVRDFEEELLTLTGQVPDLGREVHPGSRRHRDFMDLVHLDQALRDAARNISEDGAGASLDLVTKAWLHLLVEGDQVTEVSQRSWPITSDWNHLLGLGAGWGFSGSGSGWESAPVFSGLDAPLALPAVSPEAWLGRHAAPWPRQEQGICDDNPQGEGGGQEYDPTDGTATPGQNGSQRILPSGVGSDDENQDCGKVDEILEQLKTVRAAYESNLPRQGEDGYEYGRRIEVGSFGLGKPGGATSPMQTHAGGCVILGNRAYYDSQPPVVRESDCAHERVHQTTCRWARTNAAGAYEGWMVDPLHYRADEMKAYDAGIKVLEDWKAANGCSR